VSRDQQQQQPSLSLSLQPKQLDNLCVLDLQHMIVDASSGLAPIQHHVAYIHQGVSIHDFDTWDKEEKEQESSVAKTSLAQLGLHDDSTVFVICMERGAEEAATSRESEAAELEAAIIVAEAKKEALLQRAAKEKVSFFVKTITGKTLSIEMNHDDTLLDVVNYVQNREGIDIRFDCNVILHGGRNMKELPLDTHLGKIHLHLQTIHLTGPSLRGPLRPNLCWH